MTLIKRDEVIASAFFVCGKQVRVIGVNHAIFKASDHCFVGRGKDMRKIPIYFFSHFFFFHGNFIGMLERFIKNSFADYAVDAFFFYKDEEAPGCSDRRANRGENNGSIKDHARFGSFRFHLIILRRRSSRPCSSSKAINSSISSSV